MARKGWDEAEKASTAASSGGKFIRLEDGQSIIGAFVDDPLTREVVWTGESYEEYDPSKHTKNPTTRIAMNFYVPGQGMKVLDMNNTTFKLVLTMRREYGLDKNLFKIVRTGSGKDTTYTVLLNAPISPAERTAIEKAPLHNLESEDDESFDFATPQSESKISEAQAKELIGSMKRLPRQDVDAILAPFAVEKIRDLLQRDLMAVEKAVSAALVTRGLSSDNQPKGDPFAL